MLLLTQTCCMTFGTQCHNIDIVHKLFSVYAQARTATCHSMQ